MRDQLMWLILQVGWSEGKRAVIRKQLKQNCPHLEFPRRSVDRGALQSGPLYAEKLELC
jgi:hypothetical protein